MSAMRLLHLLLQLNLIMLSKSFSALSMREQFVRYTIMMSQTDSADRQHVDSEENPTLLIGKALSDEMASFKSKYPTSESDYLAAARKRAEERRESVNSQSTDEDWKTMAQKKQAEGVVVDDWEQSLVEAGNEDSQILIPIAFTEEGEDGEEPEPKLLLF